MSETLVIRGATIVDGTGGAPRRGDVRVADGRIQQVGAVDAAGARVMDGTGKLLVPGFIDVHTHYDAQLSWDPWASPSLLHGVTTVVTGNCSLSIAPSDENTRSAIIRIFEQIEDLPPALLDQHVPWTWGSFPQWLDSLRGKLGINLAPLVGHSTLRMHVMGDDAWTRQATEGELARMCAAVREAMAAGAIGVSGSDLDVDDDLRVVPARVADWREKVALCRAMMESGHGVWQGAPLWPDPAQQLRDIEGMARLSRETGCTASFAKLFQWDAAPGAWREVLRALERHRAAGARVVAQVPPRPIDLSLRLDGNSFLLLALPSWKEIMRLPLPVRLQRFASPVRRRKLVEEGMALSGLWQHTVVRDVFSDANREYRGMSLVEAAGRMKKQLPDALLTIAVADGLRTVFHLPRIGNGDDDAVLAMIRHPDAMVGGSDAGAHLAQFSGAGDATYLLEHLVKNRGALRVEEAVHHLSGRPAATWGIKDRGVIREGAHADLVLLNLDALTSGDEHEVTDLPGGGRRLVRTPTGIDAVVVNGRVVVERGGVDTACMAGVVVESERGAATERARPSALKVGTSEEVGMKYVLLGRSGLRVSELALGAMTFGTRWGFGAPLDECRRMLEMYAERGGNFIDTANQYSGGESEEIIGELLGDLRQRFVVATKYTLTMQGDDPNASGNHRKNMMQSIEASLRRLRTDYVDLFQVHAWDFTTRPDEVMRGMDDLVRSGKVLYVGISDTPAWVVAQAQTMAELRGWTPFAGLQIEYSLTERCVERELLPMARALDLGVLAWGPLAGGILTGKYAKKSLLGRRTMDSLRAPVMEQLVTPRKHEIAARVVAIANELRVPAAAVAINWLRQRPMPIIPILGARTTAQLEQSLACLGFTLSEEHLAQLDEVSAIELGFPHDFLQAPWLRASMWGELEERITRRG